MITMSGFKYIKDARAALLVLRANFAEENIENALRLTNWSIERAPYESTLTKAAFYKGLFEGLGFDALNQEEPRCPYTRGANFTRGNNNPRAAWKYGVSEGQRIRSICHYPGQPLRLSRPLSHREFKMLSPELQAKWDRATATV